MATLRIILRLIHIFSGTIWVGAAFFTALFLEPTVRAAGAEGGRFMERLVTKTPFGKYMRIASLSTVLSGIVLYWLDSGLQMSWIASREGMIFTVGALAGLAAYVTGQFVIAPTAVRIGALGNEMAMAGGPPTTIQLDQMSTLQARAMRSGIFELILMVISVAGMAGARLF